jgi:3-oxoacyl-[acyl-carrier-protein] synthase II
MTNRVVITGYGVTSAIGHTPEQYWENLKNGKTGIAPISKFDASNTGVTVAAEITDFPFDDYFERKDKNRLDVFSQYAIYAANKAVEMAELDLEATDMSRFGVFVGTGIGGLPEIEKQVIRKHDKGPKRVAPMFVPLAIPNMAAGNVSIRLGARGQSIAPVTACAAGTNAIGEAYRNIKHGYSDLIVAGGTEACISEIGVAGFANLTALTTETDPMRASIPFDKDRSGFVLGEGAGVLLLESLEHAQARGANILGEIVGYGATSDAYHITSPLQDGDGAAKAMAQAIAEAGITPEQVGYINAHGTSTPANDKGESYAIRTVFGDNSDVLVSSTKALTGHALGAAGALEAVASLQALINQTVPVNAGTQELDDDTSGINVVLGQSRAHDMDYAISNSLGFGGHNAVICLKKWSDA